MISIYVLRLRRFIGDHEGRLLRTQAPGYQLRIGHDDLDTQQFTALLRQGQQALAAAHRGPRPSCRRGGGAVAGQRPGRRPAVGLRRGGSRAAERSGSPPPNWPRGRCSLRPVRTPSPSWPAAGRPAAQGRALAAPAARAGRRGPSHPGAGRLRPGPRRPVRPARRGSRPGAARPVPPSAARGAAGPGHEPAARGERPGRSDPDHPRAQRHGYPAAPAAPASAQRRGPDRAETGDRGREPSSPPSGEAVPGRPVSDGAGPPPAPSPWAGSKPR